MSLLTLGMKMVCVRAGTKKELWPNLVASLPQNPLEEALTLIRGLLKEFWWLAKRAISMLAIACLRGPW